MSLLSQEIASYLITFEKHDEWLSCAPKTRPQNGSIILYNRKKVKYRKDGYLWKKRKDGKTTREDHMKLKVQGMEVRQASSCVPWLTLLCLLRGSHPCLLAPVSQPVGALAHAPLPMSLHFPCASVILLSRT